MSQGERMNVEAIQSNEAPPRVLVVDDSPDVHRLIKARLRQEEIEIVSANSGREGLEAAVQRRPDLILLDVEMPDLDGFEVLRALKNSSATVHIPVIIVSGLQSAQDKVTAFDLGAVDYITKPFDLMELRVRVRSALRLQRLLQMLSDRARVDGLTGLWNRALFDHRLNEELARCERHRRPLSLAMIDVDHFKSVNDTFGHPAGDAVLAGLGKLLLREARQSDVACRYGGEEFALIMPDTTPEDACVLCERVRLALSALNWPRHPDRRITASFGVSGVRTALASNRDLLIEEADKALYRAKHGGRNRIVSTELAEPAVPLAKAG